MSAAHRPGPVHNNRQTRRQGGFTLPEVMVGLLVLALGLLVQVTTTMGEYRLSRDGRHRSQALHAADQVLQRLRSDEDWPGLYERLRVLRDDASVPGTLAPSEVRLGDGRRAYVPQAYYPDFAPPPLMQSLHVLIDVPSASLDGAPSQEAVLREDVTEGKFGLPADLDLDGKLDGPARDADHLVLPVRIHLYWELPGEGAQELAIPAWIRGSR